MAVKRRWNIQSVVLDFPQHGDDLAPCAVIEVHSVDWRFAADVLVPVSLAEIGEQRLSAKERTRIHEILSGKIPSGEPFARLGWIDEAQQWIYENVQDHTIDFADDICQFNASKTFALIRFPLRDGPAYWLKATGKPNLHEFDITVCLSQLCPEHVPPLVATRTDWNAWITKDAGHPMDGTPTLPALEQAVRSFAELQQQTLNCTDVLLDAGAADHRVSALRIQIDPIIDYLTDAMRRQTSIKVPRLEERRLRELATILREALDEVESLRLPDTLIHNDVNPGNVLFDGPRRLFTDWAEACVGSPFLTFQLFCVLAEKNAPANDRGFWIRRLREAYCRSWEGQLDTSQTERACALTPLLSAFSCLYGRGDWLDSEKSTEPRFEGYARSLARHMNRAAQEPELREALCR